MALGQLRSQGSLLPIPTEREREREDRGENLRRRLTLGWVEIKKKSQYAA